MYIGLNRNYKKLWNFAQKLPGLLLCSREKTHNIKIELVHIYVKSQLINIEFIAQLYIWQNKNWISLFLIYWLQTFCLRSASNCSSTNMSNRQSAAIQNGCHMTERSVSTSRKDWPSLSGEWALIRAVWAQFHMARHAFCSRVQCWPRWASTCVV